MQKPVYNRERLARGCLAAEYSAFTSTAGADQKMPDFRGVTTLSFQVATPYFFDAVVPYGSRTECGHIYMTHDDHFMTFRHTPIWADNMHNGPGLALLYPVLGLGTPVLHKRPQLCSRVGWWISRS